MKKVLCLLLVYTTFYAGCAGRNPNPVPMILSQDKDLSCTGLKRQMDFCKAEMERLKPQTNKFGTNTLWFIGGVILLVPFFFMDFKDAEKVEYDAYSTRLAYLQTLHQERYCDIENRPKSSATTTAKQDCNMITVGAAICSICGRPIGAEEPFALYKLKRVCPECFKKIMK